MSRVLDAILALMAAELIFVVRRDGGRGGAAAQARRLGAGAGLVLAWRLSGPGRARAAALACLGVAFALHLPDLRAGKARP